MLTPAEVRAVLDAPDTHTPKGTPGQGHVGNVLLDAASAARKWPG